MTHLPVEGPAEMMVRRVIMDGAADFLASVPCLFNCGLSCSSQRHPGGKPWRRMTDGTWLPQIDDDWILTEVNERGLRIQNIRTHHVRLVAFDHVHHYMSDPARDWDSLKHGFLDLNVQLTLSGCNVFTEPQRRRRVRLRPNR
jgi:hypothetical protein